MAIENLELTTSNINQFTNCVISNYGNAFYAVPAYKTHMGNATSSTSTAPDRPISLTGYHVDENYIILSSWGEGFGVTRLNSDGTPTQIYHDNTPNNNYTYYHSIAVDKTRKIAIIGNYVYDNLRMYDFDGDWENTPTSTQLTEANSGLPSDEVGYSYTNGLAIAGDWLYISPDDKSFSHVKRWNTQTSASEDLVRTGSFDTIGRGAWYYDEPRDRMFHQPQTSYDSGLTVVVSASSYTDAKAYTVRFSSSFGSTTHYCRGDGVAIDEDNPNQLFLNVYYRTVKIDITNCLLDESDPNYDNFGSKILPVDTPINFTSNYPIYTPSSTGTYLRIATHPDVDTIWFIPDRGNLDLMYGFVDSVDGQPVFIPDSGNSIQNNNPYGVQYGNWFQKITFESSAYWINYGYGSDGYRLNVWNANDVAPELFETWSFETNALQMENSQNITKATIPDTLGITCPAGSTYTLQISNNNGSTWESYETLGTEHTFDSSGNQFKIKFSANGSTSSSPRIIGKQFQILLSDRITLQRPINRRNRVTGFKLKGN